MYPLLGYATYDEAASKKAFDLFHRTMGALETHLVHHKKYVERSI